MRSMKDKIIKKIWNILPVDTEAKQESNRDRENRNLEALDDTKHLSETAKWLCRAQDNTPDGGVSRGYKAAIYKGHGKYGWQSSYPETTGYIIPTFLALSKHLEDTILIDRALKMADWEIDIQLPSGAVMGSVVTAKPSPAVFNTGQVIFGWLAVYRKTSKEKYINAARKAGDYLLSVLCQDGSWDKGDSNFALKGATTYNTRVAWALAELGTETSDKKYIDAARKNIDLALSKQQGNGWFSDNCLNDPENPLLHTIVYATRGTLESGILLNEKKYIDSALMVLNSLLKCQRVDGGVSGRLNPQWQPAVEWDCVTGDAQAAIAWQRAYSTNKEESYKVAARKAIQFIKLTQNLKHSNPGIKGGVKGSFPFDGEYGKFEMLNWAAKFFCDAIMMANDSKLANKGIGG